MLRLDGYQYRVASFQGPPSSQISRTNSGVHVVMLATLCIRRPSGVPMTKRHCHLVCCKGLPTSRIPYLHLCAQRSLIYYQARIEKQISTWQSWLESSGFERLDPLQVLLQLLSAASCAFACLWCVCVCRRATWLCTLVLQFLAHSFRGSSFLLQCP